MCVYQKFPHTDICRQCREHNKNKLLKLLKTGEGEDAAYFHVKESYQNGKDDLLKLLNVSTFSFAFQA